MIRTYALTMLPASLLLYSFGSLLLGIGQPASGVSFLQSSFKWHHPVRRIDDSVLLGIGASDRSHYDDFNSTLDAILIPRVPGTEGHTQVRQYILRELNALGWSVTQDQFTDRTPHGRKNFANIMATFDPSACRHLVIACHYDSLNNREYTFLGATDSAVPCAMMLHTAKMLTPLLQKQKMNSPNKDVTLQLIFFDGEEAFKRWSRTDSLYGSRHLAEKWNRMAPFENGSPEKKYCTDKDYVSYLDRLDVIVLLDLIGTANPKFYSYFMDTQNLYEQIVDAEQRLNSLKMMETLPLESTTQYFSSKSTLAFVEDDHVPFMKRGVPIIHLIPSPFPHVWHRESDNRASLHHPTINNLNKILRIFISQYLHLDVPKEPLIM